MYTPKHFPVVISRIESPSDINDEVIQAAIQLSKELHFTNHMTISRRSLEKILDNPGAYWLLAKTVEGRIIGMLVLQTYQTITNGRSLIDNLVVDPEYRRKGVGTVLVDEAVAICTDLGINKARANTAVDSPASKLLAKAGFSLNPTLGYHLPIRGDE